jgi:small-conductance mechanosensitive channel
MIEDLKDMLTEKSELLNDILAKRLKIEKETKAKINTQLISHVSDIFKELKEHQQPYCYTQGFNEELEKTVKNLDLVKERRYLRD